jgi:hypothetical protein
LAVFEFGYAIQLLRATTRFRASALVAALMLLSWSTPSRADIYEFTGSTGNLSAEADFQLVGTTLTVTLTNTSTTAVSDNGSTLGGVFFSTSTPVTAVSAALNTATFTDTNNVVHNGSFVASGSIVNNVGEGWLYGNPVSVSGFNSTIAAAGYTIGFGDTGAQAFYNPPQTPLDGADYAIVGRGGINPNGGLKQPLFENSLVFTLSVTSAFSLSQLGNSVRFQWGTSLSESHVTSGPPTIIPTPTPAAPEPSTLVIAGLGGLGFLGYGLRRRTAK